MRGVRIIAGLVGLAFLSVAFAAEPKPKPYRLPSVDIKQPIIWGATCELPDGTGLAFGGQDQTAEDGRARTRVLREGKWVAISDELKADGRWERVNQELIKSARSQAQFLAGARRIYFEGLADEQRTKRALTELQPAQAKIRTTLVEVTGNLGNHRNYIPERDWHSNAAREESSAAHQLADQVEESLKTGLAPAALQSMWDIQRHLEQAADILSTEPPARMLSPIVYDPKSGLYVLFGGDHGDYLTNDTWTFDPKARRWDLRRPQESPPPRANHTLTLDPDGRIRMTGGYKYANSTDYMGGQYVDRADGIWVYDVGRDMWASMSGQELVKQNQREYRTGPFDPNYFLQGPTPGAAAFQQRLKDLPVNTWTSIKPPQLPQLNRDWGSATLDPDGDQLLRFAGGHSAHGGTDVLHFHLATGRWELPFPVEFPLGQLYTNTEYPAGWNLNHRPWITGHTYQSYAYEPLIKQMVFTGQREHSYFYDPARGDWVDRIAKPKGMTHGDCFYDLTLCQTPKGLCCWTKDGEVFRLGPATRQWNKLAIAGVKLVGSRVDNSTALYDSKRDRLLMVRKEYGDQHLYDGVLYALDLKSLEVSRVEPTNAAAAKSIPYLCQLRYSPTHDLVLAGCTLPPDETGLRRTPAYDPAKNQWISLKITGDDPSGPKGRNVSLGLMHDPKRDLFWAVDAKSNVFVLKLDPSKAEATPLR